MKWLWWRLLPVVLLHLLQVSGFCEVAQIDLGAYPVPVAETGEFVAGWFKAGGYSVVMHDYSPDGTLQLQVGKKKESYGVVIRPQSPLGSLVQVQVVSGAGAPTSAITGLRSSLNRYSAGINRERPDDHQVVPDHVLSRSNTVYCLKAPAKGGAISFSGFALDRQGLIITTAHDLDGIHTVSVTGEAGVVLRGEVIKRDHLRDLSLIRVHGVLPETVSLQNGRNKLEAGATVYMVNCPGDPQGRVKAGRIEGPPALVNGFPLWQVDMKVVPGTSGSPVFDSDGRLAGVVRGRYRGAESRGFLIPVGTIREFLDQEIQ